jgi:hypothetical protein
MRETIKDRNGKILGYIITESNGNALSQRFTGKIVGRYNKVTDEVFTFEGRYIGKGKSLLTTLI